MKILTLKVVLIAVLIAIIPGCGRESAYLLPPQVWNDTEFLVEIRPGAPRVGMNEFVVISTQTDGKPGYTYVITIKTNLSDGSSQMIQDGHSGVYRRAIQVQDPASEILIVQIVHSKETDLKTELQFPLSKHL
ncbi:hypothetical protein [Kaarinaea lacus]